MHTQRRIIWQDGTPYSPEYDDIYYMREGGLEEARYVFLHANALPQRLIGHKDVFVIAETGFGTGLNLLALRQAWDALPHPKPRLHVITTELHPLAADDMAQAHALWPELAPYSRELLQHYPHWVHPGVHRLLLADGAITLDLLVGDAAECLSRYALAAGDMVVDAWFLDGFAPAKNPAMWSEALFAAMASLSAAGTSFATFTAAGVVRRGLAAAGFTVTRQAGYGKKRDMSVGQFAPLAVPLRSTARDAVVIGAGIAGIASVFHLSQRGYHVHLLEAHAAPCLGASGNPASAFTPFYQPHWNARAQLLACGFGYTMRLLAWLQARGHVIDGLQRGVLMLHGDASNARQKRLIAWQESLSLPTPIRRDVDAAEASELAQVALNRGGWFYPQGGWIQMGDLARALLAEAAPQVQLHLNTAAQRLEHRDGMWHVHTATNIFSAPLVVVATARDAATLLPELTLTAVHGQLLHLHAPPEWQSLACAIHAGHTLMPLADGRVSWGASFRHHLSAPEVLEEETERLLSDLQQAFPQLADGIDSRHFAAWAGLRCTHPSHLPLIGAVPQRPAGLFVHLAHGARGLLSGLLPFSRDNFV